MMQISKEKRCCSLDVAEKLGIARHNEWFVKSILNKKDDIEKVSKEPLLIEALKNKRGKPTLVAYLTKAQMIYIVSNSNSNHKTKNKEMKDELVETFHKLMERAGEVDKISNLWTERKNNLITNNSVWEDNPINYFKEGELEGYFSPDVIFAEFLEALEGEVCYSLKWEWEFQQSDFPSLPVTPEQAEILNRYDELTCIDDDDEDDKNIWHPTKTLPEAPNWVLETELEPNGVVWVNQHKDLMKFWNDWIDHIKDLVKIYHSDDLRRQYGLPTFDQQESGRWKYPAKPPTAFNMVVNYHHYVFEDCYNPKEKRVYGFQVHKDWLEWLDSDQPVVKNLKEFSLDNIAKDDISDHSKTIQYEPWEAYENGFEYWQELDSSEPNLNPDCPLFQRVRLYDNRYRPLFDWYLNNVWLPQHSVKYFQQIDPEGFPKLCQAMKSLPPSNRIPHQFVKAMQPLLMEATAK